MRDNLTLLDAEKEAGQITIQEAANRLAVSRKTLLKMVKRGDISPPIRGPRQRVRYRAADIDAYIRTLIQQGEASE